MASGGVHLGWNEPHKNFTPSTGHLSTDEKAQPVQRPAAHLITHSNAKEVNSEILSLPRASQQKLDYIHQINYWLKAHYIIKFCSSILWKKISKYTYNFWKFSGEESIIFFCHFKSGLNWKECKTVINYNPHLIEISRPKWPCPFSFIPVNVSTLCNAAFCKRYLDYV